MKQVVYYILRTVWFLLSLLPLWVHYLLSDLIYLILYRLIGYRVRVVRGNLESAFPEKDREG